MNQYLKYNIADILHVYLTPHFDLCTLPFGYLEGLRNKGIITFQDLLNTNIEDYHSIQLIILLIINCLCFCCTEEKIYDLLNNQESESIDDYDNFVTSIKADINSNYKKYLQNALSHTLSEKDALIALRIWTPLLYRFNYYGEAEQLINACMACLSCSHFEDFKMVFEEARQSQITCDTEHKFDAMVNSIVRYNENQVESVLLRHTKSLNSCYQKYVICHLNRVNSKMPNTVNHNISGL